MKKLKSTNVNVEEYLKCLEMDEETYVKIQKRIYEIGVGTCESCGYIYLHEDNRQYCIDCIGKKHTHWRSPFTLLYNKNKPSSEKLGKYGSTEEYRNKLRYVIFKKLKID